MQDQDTSAAVAEQETAESSPLVRQATAEASPVVEAALAIHVTDAASMEAAGVMLRQLKHAKSIVVAIFKAPKDDAQAARRSIVAAEASVLEPLLAADNHLRSETSRWDEQLERERLAAEAKARAEAEAEAEAEQERQLQAAIDAGDEKEAEQIVAAPAESFIVQPAVTKPPPLASSVGVSKRWKGEVTDLAALVRAIARGEAPIKLVCGDGPALNAYARETKGEVEIAGVRIFQARSAVVR